MVLNQSDFIHPLSFQGFVVRVYRFLKHKKLRGTYRLRQYIRRSLQDKYVLLSYLSQFIIYIQPGHSIGVSVLDHGIYEPVVTRTIQAYVNGGGFYVDIGANIGLHTLAAVSARVKSEQQFLAFEPQPRNCAIMRENLRINNINFVNVYEYAISNEISEIDLFVGNTDGHHSLYSELASDQLIKCKTTRLDQLASEGILSDKHLYLVKIDVEGAEYEVLKGAVHWLSKLEAVALILEFSSLALDHEIYSMNDFAPLFQVIGFEEVYWLDEKKQIVTHVLINEAVDIANIILSTLDGQDGVINVLLTKGYKARAIAQLLTQ